jgi:multidrug efflux pump subunit AcrB
MNNPQADNDKPLDPAQARIVARVRRMMLVSGLTTFLGLAAIIGVIGYRFFKDEGRALADVTAQLPKGAKILSTSVMGDRIAVTIETNGQLEIHTFDLKSLKATGRLRFVTEP